MRLALALLLLVPQDKEVVHLDEVPDGFRREVTAALAAGKWDTLAGLYRAGLTRHGHKLVQSGERVMPLAEWLETACGEPSDAFVWSFEREFRDTIPGELAAARKAGAWELERLSRRYPFERDTRDVIIEAAGLHLAEKRPNAAIRCYRLALARQKPDSPARAVLLGRLAQASAEAGDDATLEWVRGNSKGIKGDIVVNGKSIGLQEYLAAIVIPAADPAAVGVVREPSVPEGEQKISSKPLTVRNDVLRGVVPLVHDRDVPHGDHPTGAATAAVGGRPVVSVTDGLQVVTFEPAAKSGKPGILWRHPEKQPLARPVAKAVQNVPSLSRFGVTMHGGWTYATLFGAGQGPIAADGWDGCREIAAFDSLTGRMKWQSDAAQLAVLEFGARNWAFTGAPLVFGATVVCAVVTAAPAMECHLVGLDAATGKVAWSRFVAATRVGDGPARRPSIAAHEDAVIIATNLGIVALFHGASGDPLWISRYKQDAAATLPREGAPLIHRTGIYVLPQDAQGLMRIERGSGAATAVTMQLTGMKDHTWRTATGPFGAMGDWLVVGGPECYVMNLVDRFDKQGQRRTAAWKGYGLPRSNVLGCGRPCVDGQAILLSTQHERPFLAVYYGVGSFKNLVQQPWLSPEDRGHLLVSGTNLIVASARRVAVYTGFDAIRSEYAVRLAQNPPDLNVWAEFVDTAVHSAQRLEAADAIAAYRRHAKGDAKHEAAAKKLAAECAELLIEEGIEARNASSPQMHKAITVWRAASDLVEGAALKDLLERRLEALETWSLQSYDKRQRDSAAEEAELVRKKLKELEE